MPRYIDTTNRWFVIIFWLVIVFTGVSFIFALAVPLFLNDASGVQQQAINHAWGAFWHGFILLTGIILGKFGS